MRRGVRVRCAIVLFIATCASSAGPIVARDAARQSPRAATVTLGRAEAVADERTLLASLRSTHPNLFFARAEPSVEDEARKIEDHLSARPTRLALFRAFAPLVASLGDGHTYIDPYLPEYRAYRDRGGPLFPLELDCAAVDPVVVTDFDPASRIPAGATVYSIGDSRARDIIARLGRYGGGDTAASKRVDACRNIRVLAWIDGFTPPYLITYRLPGSIAQQRSVLHGVTIDSVHRWDRTVAATHRFKDYELTFADKGAIAILTMHSFDDPSAFATFAENAFRQIRLMRSKALLIDVRENVGGDLALARVLMDRIASRPYRLVAEMDTKVSQLVKNTLGPRRYREIYGARAWAAHDGTVLHRRFERIMLDDIPERFRGRVFVLVGSGTFSSAAMFAAAVQDQRFGTILGAPSGGNATLYGERFDFVLPNSHLSVSVSTKRFTRPSGNPQLSNVVPDHPLGETAQVEAVDDELRAALEVARHLPQ
jgi:hypothetical protein